MGLADINVDGTLIKGAFDGVSNLMMTIKSLITGKISPEQEAELTKQLTDISANINNAQAEVNKIEAASQRTFVAGWRPFVGWVCGIAFAYNYVFMPFFSYVARWIDASAPAMPALEMGELMTILIGMLGLSGMRTYEKTK